MGAGEVRTGQRVTCRPTAQLQPKALASGSWLWESQLPGRERLPARRSQPPSETVRLWGPLHLMRTIDRRMCDAGCAGGRSRCRVRGAPGTRGEGRGLAVGTNPQRRERPRGLPVCCSRRSTISRAGVFSRTVLRPVWPSLSRIVPSIALGRVYRKFEFGIIRSPALPS